jgi:hypothetical protein
MNETMKAHGGKVLFGGVLVLCGIFVAVTTSEGDPPEFSELSKNQQKIQNVLVSHAPITGYKYSATGVKYADAFAKAQERTKEAVDEPGRRVAYPRPAKPDIDEDTRPHPADERHAKILCLGNGEALPKGNNGNIYYAVANPTEVSAKADHGKVFVAFRVPENGTIELAVEKTDPKTGVKSVVNEKRPVTTVVRAEIFKGLTEDKIDTKAPFAVLEYTNEQPVRDLYPDEQGTAKPKEKTDDASAGSLRRTEKTSDAPKEEKKEEKEVTKVEDVPVEYAGIRVFEDTHVDPQVSYFYKVRLITRMDPPPEVFFSEPDSSGTGKIFRRTVFHAPKNAEVITPAQANTKTRLYAGTWSDVVSTTTPPEYKFRFQGTEGEFSAYDTPVHLVSQDYKGLFDTQVWVNEAQEWRPLRLPVAKGEQLKGTVQGSKKPKFYTFDTHRQLEEIVWRKEMIEREVEDYVRDKEGNPVKDPEDEKKFLKKKEKITKESMPFQVAILKDLQTGKLEEYRIAHDKEKQDLAIKYFTEMAKRQKEEETKRKEELKKIIERNRRHEAELKAKQQPMYDEWGPMGPGMGPAGGPPGGGGPGGGGGPSGGPGGGPGGGGNGPMHDPNDAINRGR